MTGTFDPAMGYFIRQGPLTQALPSAPKGALRHSAVCGQLSDPQRLMKALLDNLYDVPFVKLLAVFLSGGPARISKVGNNLAQQQLRSLAIERTELMVDVVSREFHCVFKQRYEMGLARQMDTVTQNKVRQRVLADSRLFAIR